MESSTNENKIEHYFNNSNENSNKTMKLKEFIECFQNSLHFSFVNQINITFISEQIFLDELKHLTDNHNLIHEFSKMILSMLKESYKELKFVKFKNYNIEYYSLISIAQKINYENNYNISNIHFRIIPIFDCYILLIDNYTIENSDLFQINKDKYTNYNKNEKLNENNSNNYNFKKDIINITNKINNSTLNNRNDNKIENSIQNIYSLNDTTSNEQNNTVFKKICNNLEQNNFGKKAPVYDINIFHDVKKYDCNINNITIQDNNSFISSSYSNISKYLLTNTELGFINKLKIKDDKFQDISFSKLITNSSSIYRIRGTLEDLNNNDNELILVCYNTTIEYKNIKCLYSQNFDVSTLKDIILKSKFTNNNRKNIIDAYFQFSNTPILISASKCQDNIHKVEDSLIYTLKYDKEYQSINKRISLIKNFINSIKNKKFIFHCFAIKFDNENKFIKILRIQSIKAEKK